MRQLRVRGVLAAASGVAAGAVLLAGCGHSAEETSAAGVSVVDAAVEKVLPWDSSLFTQGVETIPGSDAADPEFVVSGGLTGQSLVERRRASGVVTVGPVRLDEDQFGEGVAWTGRMVWQLTWKNGVVVGRDPETLEEVTRVGVQGQGWGACTTEEGQVFTSDGSSTLTLRDGATFAPVGSVKVTREGTPVELLNELECSGGVVWANVWKSPEVVGIDPHSGQVVKVVDVSALVAQEQGGDPEAVANGVASVPGRSDALYVTGKRWKHLYLVNLRGE